MRAFLIGLLLFLTPAFALAVSPNGGQADQSSQSKKKKKKKKKKSQAAGSASTQRVAIDTSMPVTAIPPTASPDDLDIVPLDVEHMIFDAKAIQDVIQHHMPQILACYEKVLATSSSPVEGTVMASFTIDVTGIVTDAKYLPKKSTMKDERAIDCVVNRVRRLVFPRPPDNRRYPIEFPFNLTVKK